MREHAPSACDCFKIVLGNPRLPMLRQCCPRNIGILVLSKSPLVNDEGIARLFE
jgi:hypothetical protein